MRQMLAIKNREKKNRFADFKLKLRSLHYIKSVPTRSFSGPYFPAFKLNTETYEENLRIQSVCGKILTRKSRVRTLFTQCKDLDFSLNGAI